jgi:hypothetical protein
MESIHESLRVLGLLVQRELYVMRQSWRSIMFSALVFSVLLACASRYFLPLMGMSEECIIPLFLGSFIVSCLSIGYACCLEVAYDLRSPQLIRYYSTLPVPFGCIIGAQVLGIMIRIIVLAIPVLFCGLCIINMWMFLHISWVALLGMIVLAAAFNALFFLILAYQCSIPVLLGNVWPRFLSPLFAFGCALYPWRTVEEHSPFFAQVLLYNPMTYCVEGLRSACLGGSAFLPIARCMQVLFAVNCMLSVVLWFVSVNAVRPVRLKRSSL